MYFFDDGVQRHAPENVSDAVDLWKFGHEELFVLIWIEELELKPTDNKRSRRLQRPLDLSIMGVLEKVCDACTDRAVFSVPAD